MTYISMSYRHSRRLRDCVMSFSWNYNYDNYGGAVLQWLAHWTSDLKVGDVMPNLCHHVVSSGKKLYPTLSLSTQVYKWVPATYCWG